MKNIFELLSLYSCFLSDVYVILTIIFLTTITATILLIKKYNFLITRKPLLIFLLFGLGFLNIFGYSIIEVTTSTILLKNIGLITSTTIILYELLSLFLLYKFSVNNIILPDNLPNFINNWLNEFKSPSKPYIEAVKKDSYIQIFIYSVIILLFIFI